jgi:hypothetical protein
VTQREEYPPVHKDRVRRDELRLDIVPIIASAEQIAQRVADELPGHPGLARAAGGVGEAAREAHRVSRRLRRPFGWHRLPAAFLLMAMLAFGGWLYWQFFHTSTLKVAVSQRDAVQFATSVNRRVRFVPVSTVGSRESLDRLEAGEVDLAFVQGGVEIPADLPRTKLSGREWVLLFLRRDIASPAQVSTVLTSAKDQGSHTLADVFMRIWRPGQQTTYIHDWRTFTDDTDFEIEEHVDAVFVVKDPLNQKVVNATARLENMGFELASPEIGAWTLRLPYLEETTIRPGYLDPIRHLPHESVATYAVSTYLVARPHLTPHQLAVGAQLLSPPAAPSITSDMEPTFQTANEIIQGLEATLGIIVYIGVAFLALMGLDIITYRRRFNELNSLVSLISMHQSTKDVVGTDPALCRHNAAYLSTCSDLLGLIAVITGYYTQENSSLLYNRLLETIHERCDGLKINIQLKILHALIELPEVPMEEPPSPTGADVAVEVPVPAADANSPASDAECNEPPPEKMEPPSQSDSSA